jgi:hypothetical protein
MPEPPALYVRQNLTDYRPSELVKFQEALVLQDRNTAIRPVTSAESLLLNRRGQLPDGYRYTSTAFRQVCSATAHGLRPLVLHLAGVKQDKLAPAEAYSFSDAIDVFNLAVRRKFLARELSRCQMVLDLRTKLVDGLLGPTAVALENGVLLQCASEVAQSSGRELSFQLASLTGRRMLVRFVEPTPVVTYQNVGLRREDTYYSGFQLTNSGISGESIRVCPILYRPLDQTTIMMTARGDSIVLTHVGRNLVSRLKRLFVRLAARLPIIAQSAQKIADLQLASLRLDVDREIRGQQVERLIAHLRDYDIPRSLARQIVDCAICYGSGVTRQADASMLTRREMESRNWCDMLHGVTMVAKQLPWSKREVLERFAYQILTGKVHNA